MPRLYVIVRNDITPGLQAAQAVHAALEYAVANPADTNEWARESNYLIIVQQPDEYALMGTIEKAHALGIPHVAVREPDLNDEITAIAFKPGDAARRLCAGMPLALREPAMT